MTNTTDPTSREMPEIVQNLSTKLRIIPRTLKIGILIKVAILVYFTTFDGIQAFFDAILGKSPFGLANLPYYLLTSSIYFGQLYIKFLFRKIWSEHYKFKKVNWYYNLDIGLAILYILMYSIFVIFAVLSFESVALSLNQLFVSIQNFTGRISGIAGIIAFIQLSALPDRLFGMKSWIIGISVLNSFLSIFVYDIPLLLLMISTVIYVIFLVRLRRSLPPGIPSQESKKSEEREH